LDNTAAFLMFVPQLPLLITYLFGLGLAVFYARSLPRAALMAGIGFGLLAASWLVGAASQYWVATIPRGVSVTSLAPTIAAFGLATQAAIIAGTIFLMFAIFLRRGGASNA
jgi:hypothetical protein